MPQPSSSVPQLVKKFEPWKAIVVGIAAVIASLVGLAAMGANARGALDKKVDTSDFLPLRDDVNRIKQAHEDDVARWDRIERKVDLLLQRRR